MNRTRRYGPNRNNVRASHVTSLPLEVSAQRNWLLRQCRRIKLLRVCSHVFEKELSGADLFFFVGSIILVCLLLIISSYGSRIANMTHTLTNDVIEVVNPNRPAVKQTIIDETQKKIHKDIFLGDRVNLEPSRLTSMLVSGDYSIWFNNEEVLRDADLMVSINRLQKSIRALQLHGSAGIEELAAFLTSKAIEGKEPLLTSCGSNRTRSSTPELKPSSSVSKSLPNSLDIEECRKVIKMKGFLLKPQDNDDLRVMLLFCPTLVSSVPSKMGFLRATGHVMQEVECTKPMDDIALLKLRFQSMRLLSGQEHGNRTSGDTDSSTEEINERTLYQAYVGSSVLNRRYYYPLRRYAKLQSFSPASYAETTAWEEAVNVFYGKTEEYQFKIPYLPKSIIEGIQKTFLEPQRSVLPDSLTGSTAQRADTKTIFISVASYRDSECGMTLLDAFQRAKNPFRIYLGVAEQHLPFSNDDGKTKASPTHDATCVRAPMYEPMLVFKPITLKEEEEYGNLNFLGSDDSSDWSELARRRRALQLLKERQQAAFIHGGVSENDRFDKMETPPPKNKNNAENGRSTNEEARAEKNLFFNHVHGIMVPEEHVRRRKVNAHRAKGPTFGRFVAMLLYRGEDFALVIDSHHRFVPHWDVMAVYWFDQFKRHRTVISHYPEAFEYEKDFALERSTSAYLCQAKFVDAMGYIRLQAIIVADVESVERTNEYNTPYLHDAPTLEDRMMEEEDEKKKRGNDRVTEKPLLGGHFRLPQPWIAGGFLFAPGLMLREVPFDPHLPQLFDGEEVLFGVRLWTHGYNLYSPPRNLAYHIYGRDKAPKIWSDEGALWNAHQPHSQDRVRYLLRSRFKKDATKPEEHGGQLRIPDEVEIRAESRKAKNVVTTSAERNREEKFFLLAHKYQTLPKNDKNVARFSAEMALCDSTTEHCDAASSSLLHQYPHNSAHRLPRYIKMDLLRYGLGNKRELADWYDYAGADPVKYELDGRWCGKPPP